MEKVYRQDAIKCDKVRIDSSGILRAKVAIARIGIQNYYEDGKLIRELRLPEDVKASADSFSQQVVTLGHPPEMVNSANAHIYSKGLTGDRVEYEDGFLTTNITITHKDAVDSARQDYREFSNGYWAELRDEQGTWKDDLGVMGEPGKEYEYDRRQANIVGNHIALVKIHTARAGSKATFLDSVDSGNEGFIIKLDDNNIPSKSITMTQIIHNDSVLTIQGDSADAIQTLIKELKDSNVSLVEEKNNLTDKVNQLEGEKTSLQGKVDGLEADKNEPKMDAAAIATETEARLAAWSQVLPHLDSDYTPDYKLDAVEIKKLYLTKAVPNLAEKIERGDANYVEALWDVKQPTEKTKVDSVKEAIADAAPAPVKDLIAEAQAAYIQARTRN